MFVTVCYVFITHSERQPSSVVSRFLFPHYLEKMLMQIFNECAYTIYTLRNPQFNAAYMMTHAGLKISPHFFIA